MQSLRAFRGPLLALFAAIVVSAAPVPADACTRVLYVAKDGTVIVGRSMYWDGDMMPIMWVLPRALVSVRGLD
jgi:penicillin V acylase-like amidase (Ntn superfamily)